MAKKILPHQEYLEAKALKKVPEKVKEVLKQSEKTNYDKGNISYSQVSTYWTCPTKWYYTYVQKLVPYRPSIHTVFGKSMHDTIQSYLKVYYNHTIREADEMKLNSMLFDKMKFHYTKEMKSNKGEHFSDSEEMTLIHLEGTHILNYLKKKKGVYFSKKNTLLAGVETLLYQPLPNGKMFIGYIDIVLYDKRLKKWKLIDIKTSTLGWNKYDKKDTNKTSQLLLYKNYFAKQFDIPLTDIDVEYFIVKRRIPSEADFAIMQRRVQEFKPSSGKILIGRLKRDFDEFLNNTLDDKDVLENTKVNSKPTKSNCMFCIFKTDKSICKVGIES